MQFNAFDKKESRRCESEYRESARSLDCSFVKKKASYSAEFVFEWPVDSKTKKEARLVERWSEATRKATRGRIKELKDDVDAKEFE